MDSKLLTDVGLAIREGSLEDRQALLLAMAAALAAVTGAGKSDAVRTTSPLDDDRLLSMPEVATQLGIPKDRAYDLGRQGRLPVVSIGKYRRVRQSAVTAFLRTNETTGLEKRRYAYSPTRERRGRRTDQ